MQTCNSRTTSTSTPTIRHIQISSISLETSSTLVPQTTQPPSSSPLPFPLPSPLPPPPLPPTAKPTASPQPPPAVQKKEGRVSGAEIIH